MLRKFFGVFGVILLLTLISLPQSVFAEKTDWFDRDFNFRNIRTVIVFNVAASPSMGYTDTDSILVRNLQDTLIQNARKNLRCNVMTEAEARRALSYQLGMDLESLNYSNPMQARHVITQNAYRIADAWVATTVDNWYDNSYVKPGYTTWEQRKETRIYRDRHGNRHEESYYVQVPVDHPPQRIDISTLQMTLQVYEARRGDMIFARKDVRDREDYQAQKGMFGRICNSFFEDFGKKLR